MDNRGCSTNVSKYSNVTEMRQKMALELQRSIASNLVCPNINNNTFLVQNAHPVAKEDKTDIKSLDFNILIAKLDGKELLECLNKINKFLKSPNNELVFHDISEYIETLLVRVIRNFDILRSENIPVICKEVCNEIVDTVKYNADNRICIVVSVYRLEPRTTLLGGRGVNCKNVLVYKKLYYAQQNITRPTESISSLSNSPPLSRSTSTESLDRSITLPTTDHFQNHCLHLILKFIKDKTRTNLEFTGLTVDEAYFVYSTFSSIIHDKQKKVDKISSAIKEAYKIFATVYEFRVKYVGSGNNKSVLLEKSLKREQDPKTQPKEPKKKYKDKNRERFNRLSQKFICDSLNKIITFLKEESEGSIFFLSNDQGEKWFLKNAINYCRSERIKNYFTDDVKKLFDDLRVLVEKPSNFKLRIKDNKNKYGNKEVTFVKTPSFQKPAKKSRPWMSMENTASNATNKTVGNETKGTQKPNICFESAGVLNPLPQTEQTAMELESETDNKLVEVMKAYDEPVPGFENKPENPTLERQPQVSNLNAQKFKSTPKLKLKKDTEKIIEALSVPVQCDKAMKMMLGMGWKGGALGSRGNGLIEPIMPHFTAKGQGLGHKEQSQYPTKATTAFKTPNASTTPSNIPIISNTPTISATPKTSSAPKPPKKQNPPRPVPDVRISRQCYDKRVFRKLYLQQLAGFLASDAESIVISFDLKLNKKEISFCLNTTNTFCERRNMTLKARDEQAFIKQIKGHLANNPQLRFSACVSNDYSYLTLKKFYTVIKPITPEVVLEEQKVLSYDSTAYVDSYLHAFAPLDQSQSENEKTRFNVEVLLKILNFLKESTSTQRMEFGRQLSEYQIEVISRLFDCCNRMAKFGNSPPEKALNMEIRKLMGSFNIYVKRGFDMTSVTAIKVYQKPGKKRPAEESDTKLSKMDAEKLNKVNKKLKDGGNLLDIAGQMNEIYVKDSTDDNVIEISDDDLEISDDDDDMDIENDCKTQGNTDKCQNAEVNDQNSEKPIEIGDVIPKNNNKMETNNNKSDGDSLKNDTNNTSEDLIEVNDFETEINDSIKYISLIEDYDDIMEKDIVMIDDFEETNETLKQIGDNHQDIKENNEEICDIDQQIIDQTQEANSNVEKNTEINQNCTEHNQENLKKDENVTELDQQIHKHDQILDEHDQKHSQLDNINAKTAENLHNVEIMPEISDITIIEHDNNIENINNNSQQTENKLQNEVIAEATTSKETDIQITEENYENNKQNVDIKSEYIEIADKESSYSKKSDSLLGYEEMMSICDTSADVDLDCSVSDDKADSLMTEYGKISNELDFNTNKDQTLDKEEKSDIKIVYLTKNVEFNKDTAKEIQCLISMDIRQSDELPLLKCHGVRNGALVYSCHNEKSFVWLQNLCTESNINMIIKDFDKMAAKIDCFVDVNDKYLFNMLEKYNKQLSTKYWSVLKKDILDDCVIFYVKMDKKSFEYVLDSNLALYAGVDRVTFSIIWE